jgi:hypothetical protein
MPQKPLLPEQPTANDFSLSLTDDQLIFLWESLQEMGNIIDLYQSLDDLVRRKGL